MANIKKAGSSTGKRSTKTRTLASEKEKAGKPSKVARTKSENASGLEILSDILSLLQEDVRRYNEAMVNHSVMIKQVDGLIVLIIPPPIGHVLDFDSGHILLDGKPVTGWSTQAPKITESAQAKKDALNLIRQLKEEEKR